MGGQGRERGRGEEDVEGRSPDTTSSVGFFFGQPDSWTDCLYSNTLLCRTLFFLFLPPTHTKHSHTFFLLLSLSASLNTSLQPLFTCLPPSVSYISSPSPSLPTVCSHSSFPPHSISPVSATSLALRKPNVFCVFCLPGGLRQKL